MSDENTSAGTGAPAAPPAPVTPPVSVAVPPAPPAPAPAPAPAAQSNEDPAWLPGRLERASASARNALLSDLGVTNVDEAKSAIAAAKAAADAKKSAEERAVELATQLTQTKSVAEQQAAAAKEMAGRMLGALTQEQQKAVTDFAGDDPVKQFAAIKAFGPTWAEAERVKEAAAQAAAAAAQAAAKPPAQTSPPAGAPDGSQPGSPPDPQSVYATAKAKNPFAAAAYGLSNLSVYETPKQ